MTTQTRVRELVYLLRQSRVFERTDQWGAAIRELVTLGSAALPELLLELKNTERSATLRGLLFTLRAIDDPRAIASLIDVIPKAERLSQPHHGSDCRVDFSNPDLHRFMKQHESCPSDDDAVAYSRPVNEILVALHKLSRQPLPDVTKPGSQPTWRTDHWNEWWKAESTSGRRVVNGETIQLPSRDEDLVEQDGIRRFGPLFPTGSGQRLSPAVDVALTSRSCADGHSCLDFETGRLYEYLEGLEDAAEKTHDRLYSMQWFIRHGIDLTADGGHDLHLWLIDNARWDGLDSEVRSEEPFQVGPEADSADFHSDQIETFLFTTQEGSRGVLRAYPTKRHRQSKRFEYRLWNRDTIEPGAHTQPSPPEPGAWQPDKTVVLKQPGFGKECLFDLETGRAHVLPASIFASKPLPEIDELLRFGGILRNNPITAWARRRGIVLATHISEFASEDEDQALNNGQMAELTLLDARQTQVTQDAFKNLTPAHAREIMARYPYPYRVASMHPPLDTGSPPATWLFETQTRLLGILEILKVGDGLASIEFHYKLAHRPTKGGRRTGEAPLC